MAELGKVQGVTARAARGVEDAQPGRPAREDLPRRGLFELDQRVAGRVVHGRPARVARHDVVLDAAAGHARRVGIRRAGAEQTGRVPVDLLVGRDASGAEHREPSESELEVPARERHGPSVRRGVQPWPGDFR